MKTVNVHRAKTMFSALLAEIERDGQRIVICRNGKPVADLIPHPSFERREPDAVLGQIKINYDPTAPLSPSEWPEDAR